MSNLYPGVLVLWLQVRQGGVLYIYFLFILTFLSNSLSLGQFVMITPLKLLVFLVTVSDIQIEAK